MWTDKVRPAITWKTYDSITALPPGFWNEKIAGHDLSRQEAFLKLLEKHTSDSEPQCLVAYCQQRIMGCAFFLASEWDLTVFLPAPVAFSARMLRWIVPKFLFRYVAAAGADVTDGEHWWFDSDCWTWEEFFWELNQQLDGHRPRFD